MTQSNGDGRTVGIVTIVDYTNYGNRLQNYAVQSVLNRLGFDAETIINFPNASGEPGKAWTREHTDEARRKLRAGRMSRLTDRLRGQGPLHVAANVLQKLRRRYAPSASEREAAAVLKLKLAKAANGRAFTRANIRETDFTVYRDTPGAPLNARFDHFVVGSDQVWNPHFRRLAPIDFLPFADPPKRVAFSASMGVAQIPPEHEDAYREGIAGFAHVSVREDAAAAEVLRLTGRTVPVTIDPTLVLTAEDWRPLAAVHPARPAGQYLLTYFIGQRTPDCQRMVDDFVARHGMAVVHLNDPASPDVYAADPAAFLGFIRDAAIFFTDSFHGAIFSVLMDTPFLTFPRVDASANMGSRMDTLLRTLQLEHRKFSPALTEAERDAFLVTDYAHTPPIIVQKRAEAMDYLTGALALAPTQSEPAPA